MTTNPKRSRHHGAVRDLRRAIDRLPRKTRLAMLDGLRANAIVAGTHADRDGVCPMVAAQREGAHAGSAEFAAAWDRFVLGGARPRVARLATGRERLVLAAQLEASLYADAASGRAARAAAP